MRAIPAIFAALILATAAPTLAPSQPPSPQFSSDKTSVAFIGGKWVIAETRDVAKVIPIETTAKWTTVRVRQIKRNAAGEEYLILGKVEVLPIVPTSKSEKLFGIVAGPGRYLVESFSYDPSSAPELDEFIITVGKPDPDPDDPDPPPVDDAPFASDGFAVLIIKEATAVVPESQRAIFTSAEVHRYCYSKCQQLGDGGPFYRQWDDDYTDSELANAPAELRAAYKAVKPKSLPWIAISDGKGGGFSGPLPATVDETLELLKRYGDG